MIGRQNSIGRLTSRRKQRRQNDQNAISSVYRFVEGKIAAIPRSLRSPIDQTKHERGRAVDNRSSIHELHRSIRLWPWIIDRSSSHEVGERDSSGSCERWFLGVCADGSIYIYIYLEKALPSKISKYFPSFMMFRNESFSWYSFHILRF